MNIASETLVEAMQKVILTYEVQTGQVDDTSMQQVADAAAASYTTIREIKKGVLKYLSVKKALEMSSRLLGLKTLDQLLHFAQIRHTGDGKEYSDRFSHLFDHSVMPKAYAELITDKDYARILWAAFGNTHIRREEIRSRWGSEGEEKLNELLKFGFVIEVDGVIKGVVEKASCGSGSIDAAYKQLGIGHTLYKRVHAQKQENWVSFQTNSVNDLFIATFREDLRAFFTKYDEKSSSSEYVGNKRMFFGMIFDRYMEDLIEGKETLQ